MRVGSLCTGYGGLEMGIEQAFGPIDLVFVSDIDKDVGTLLAHHHPNTPNLGDLTKVNWKQQQPVDLLCAGYPCQPFSTAGLRKGTEDERAIFGWIADAISVLRPERVLLENVAGHLTLGGVGVIAELTRLGYDCQWGVVRASDAGAAHRRARLFIWAKPTDTSGERLQGHVTESNSTLTTDTGGGGLQDLWPERGLGETAKSRCFGFFGAYEPAIRRWEQIMGRPAPYPVDDKGIEPAFVEWMMGLPEGHVTSLGLSRTAELKMLGNGVVPQQAALALHYLTQERVPNAA
jgi:DNA (cytosine-5)-methyltransferase 1